MQLKYKLALENYSTYLRFFNSYLSFGIFARKFRVVENNKTVK